VGGVVGSELGAVASSTLKKIESLPGEMIQFDYSMFFKWFETVETTN